MMSEDDVAICDGGMHRGDLISGNIVYIRVFYIKIFSRASTFKAETAENVQYNGRYA